MGREELPDARAALTLMLDDIARYKVGRGELEMVDHRIKWTSKNRKIATEIRLPPLLEISRDQRRVAHINLTSCRHQGDAQHVSYKAHEHQNLCPAKSCSRQRILPAR